MDKNHGHYKSFGETVTLSTGHTVGVSNLFLHKDNNDKAVNYTIGVKFTRPDYEVEGEILETKFALSTEAAYMLYKLLERNVTLQNFIEHYEL
jgi:hypothetical protein